MTDTKFCGGSFEETKLKGVERHHPVSWEALKLLGCVTKADSPVIQMTPSDHRATVSYKGPSVSSVPFHYRDSQAQMVSRGYFWKVWNIDVATIRQVHGNKYDQAIAQAEKYVRGLENEGKLQVDPTKAQLYNKYLQAQAKATAYGTKLKERTTDQAQTRTYREQKTYHLAEAKLYKSQLLLRHEALEKKGLKQDSNLKKLEANVGKRQQRVEKLRSAQASRQQVSVLSRTHSRDPLSQEIAAQRIDPLGISSSKGCQRGL